MSKSSSFGAGFGNASDEGTERTTTRSGSQEGQRGRGGRSWLAGRFWRGSGCSYRGKLDGAPAGSSGACSRFIVKHIGAYAVCVLVSGIAMVEMVFPGAPVVVPALTVRPARMGQGGKGKAQTEQQQNKKTWAHTGSFQRELGATHLLQGSS